MSVILESSTQPVLIEQTTSFYIPIEDDDSTVFSNHAAHNNEMITYSKKRYSDGYRSFMKTTKTRQGNGKPSLFEYFTTKNIIGYPIRNARTGYLYPQYRVGRIHEYLFFKVRLSNEDSYQANQFMFSKTPNHNPNEKEKPDLDVLFYDSPEEYESHHQIQLSFEAKRHWRDRYEKLIRFMEKNNRKFENQQPQQQQQPQPQESTKILLQQQISETPSPPGLTNNYPIRSMTPDYPPPDLVV